LITAQTNLAYGDHPRQQLDVYTPAEASGVVVVFWHGGSWQRGDKHTYRFVGRALARLGYTAVIANYRLYPEVRWPAFAEDAAAVVAWARRKLAPTKLIAMGHSAGGQIAAATCFDDYYLHQRGVGGTVAGLIGLAGGYDFHPANVLRPILETGDRPWKPVDLVADKPLPCLLFHGRIDTVVAISNSRSLAQAIRRHGGRVVERYYPLFDHMTLLAPLVVGWWLVPSMRRAIVDFVNSV
jgi:acetyl esterase/lipase